MSGFQCPYCSMVMSITNDTVRERRTSFETHDLSASTSFPSCIKLTFCKCPSCGKYTISAKGINSSLNDLDMQLQPISNAKQYPDYIPQAVRNDYEEACAIVNFSPKASATLSRRCIQGMIHDYWNIKLKNLNQEITALKDKISPDLWSCIDALRQLGNIGAHMEKDINTIVDIDSNEAESLIKLIELLMKEWYITREDRKNLFNDILTTNEAKQADRKKTE